MEVIRIPLAKQEEANNKKQRSKLLFNNDTLSDVKFVVRASQHGENDTKRSKIVVPAHKFVLSICSPVFFRMFCGEMAENGEQIELPDCEYEGIFELLRYFYTDEVCLNGNNVMQVLYVAKKYMVSCLAKECVKFLKTNVDSSNVFCVLKHAQQYVNEDLLGLCWYLIDKQTEEAMSSCEFLSIEKSLLQQLLERSTLEIKEVELFKAVDRWAAKECERQNLTADGPVKRQILGDQIFKNIRFPAMKQSDFMEVVLNSKMLTEEEATGAFTSFRMHPEPDPPYDGFLVLFDVQVTLKKEVKYGFEASIDGLYSSVKTRIVNNVDCAGVRFSLKDPRWKDEEEDWGDGMPTGQLAELFFKVKT
ncbi:hypothetical protein ACROYT_G036618 [Oculina patagonica]